MPSCRRSPHPPGRRASSARPSRRSPRRYAEATNPATSVVEPPPTATSVPLRSRRSSCHRRSHVSSVFACSRRAIACIGASSGGGWSPSTRSSTTTSPARGPALRVARTSLPRRTAPAAASTMPSASCARRVCRLLVERLALLVERAELALSSRRAAASVRRARRQASSTSTSTSTVSARSRACAPSG